jgi:hypothetical protein
MNKSCGLAAGVDRDQMLLRSRPRGGSGSKPRAKPHSHEAVMQNLKRRNRPEQPYELVEQPSAPNQQHVRTRVILSVLFLKRKSRPSPSKHPSHCDPPSMRRSRSLMLVVWPISPRQSMSEVGPASRCAPVSNASFGMARHARLPLPLNLGVIAFITPVCRRPRPGRRRQIAPWTAASVSRPRRSCSES